MTVLKNNFLMVAAIFTAFFLGSVAGYYTFYKAGPISELCELEYISYDEIMKLEKKRLELMGSANEDKNLFYGRGKEVAEKISRIAGGYKSNRVKVLLTSGTINGNNVRSLSAEVHARVLAELEANGAGVKK